MATQTNAWPIELRLVDDGTQLNIVFDDESGFALPAEFLRVESPSAEVKGHGAGQEKTAAGKRNVRIFSVEPVGNYAVRLIFSDGHNTGIYSWTTLHRLGSDQVSLWQNYLDKLSAESLSRD